MFLVILLAICAALLLGFCLLIFGFTSEVKGGLVIQARRRAGIVRYAE